MSQINVKNLSNHLQVGMKYLPEGEKSYNFGCVADTLNNILLKSNAPKKIDFLSPPKSKLNGSVFTLKKK